MHRVSSFAAGVGIITLAADAAADAAAATDVVAVAILITDIVFDFRDDDVNYYALS